MVDVTPKEPTHRRAMARGRVYMQPETTALVARGAIAKGDVLAVARVAGIQAAKRTSDLIPLCHPLLVGSVFVNFRIEDRFVEVETQVDTVDRTGVEMEALTACSVACLTIYDMCKSADRAMVLGDIALWEKTGGRSGTFRRSDSSNAVPSGRFSSGADVDAALSDVLDRPMEHGVASFDADEASDL
jgi:cyclic pyranopterin phosphate synthase